MLCVLLYVLSVPMLLGQSAPRVQSGLVDLSKWYSDVVAVNPGQDLKKNLPNPIVIYTHIYVSAGLNPHYKDLTRDTWGFRKINVCIETEKEEKY